MNIDMAHALAGDYPDVGPDVVTQRVELKIEEFLTLPDERQEFLHFVSIEIRKNRAVPDRDYEEMSGRYRVPVEPGIPDPVGEENIRPGPYAERATGATGLRISHNPSRWS